MIVKLLARNLFAQLADKERGAPEDRLACDRLEELALAIPPPHRTKRQSAPSCVATLRPPSLRKARCAAVLPISSAASNLAKLRARSPQ
jgi:hypothetical protein